MKKTDFSQQSEDYRRIERALYFLESNFRRQPELDEIARAACLSRYHFDRLFKRWAGISPIQFLQFLTLDYTKRKLARSRSILDAALDGGLSGPGRLHDLFVTFEGMSPGEYKRMGAGLEIAYGFHPTPFGECVIATTARGICHLGFVEGKRRPAALDRLAANWPKAAYVERKGKTRTLVEQIFSPRPAGRSRPFHLLVKGTNFQVNVWQALLRIPEGTVLSYGDIAAYLGQSRTARAVANAVAINPVGYLIPCHRVIAGTGRIHGYRWGEMRKKAILGWEDARTG